LTTFWRYFRSLDLFGLSHSSLESYLSALIA
jgi:hypothetical protein